MRLIRHGDDRSRSLKAAKIAKGAKTAKGEERGFGVSIDAAVHVEKTAHRAKSRCGVNCEFAARIANPKISACLSAVHHVRWES